MQPIDPPGEIDPLLSFGKARELFPRVDGKLPSPAAIFRFSERGIHGVRLRTEWVNGRRCTRASWIEQFQSALNTAMPGDLASHDSEGHILRDPNGDDPYITFSDAVKILPRVDGARMTLANLRRWANEGCRGRKLQVAVIGEIYFTRRSWLEAFVEIRNAPVAYTGPTITPERQRERDNTDRELAKRGYLGGDAKKVALSGGSMAAIRAAVEAGREKNRERVRKRREREENERRK